MFENVSVIGGDLRQLTVAKLLKAEGYHVFLYGFDKDIQLETLECETDKDLVLSADIVILRECEKKSVKKNPSMIEYK